MKNYRNLLLAAPALFIAGISPNLFVLAQAGYANFQSLVLYVLIPSLILLVFSLGLAYYLKFQEVFKLILHGIIAGLIATIGLELVRETGFRAGAMPGDLPRLMGVVMLDHFSTGPDTWSDLAGWAYHFWNGASFGIIFSLISGKPALWQGAIFGIMAGILFMISSVVSSLGIGLFGVEFKEGYQFAVTVIIAHIAYGTILAMILVKLNAHLNGLFYTAKRTY